MSVAKAKPAPTPVVKAAAKKPATKTVSQPGTKVASKSATKPSTTQLEKGPGNRTVSTPATEPKNTVAKEEKIKKIKMVRDSFTIPKAEFAVLDALKSRALQLKAPVKKTELIRAGIKALAAMPDSAFLAAIRAVPSLKTGRPSKGD